MPMSPAFYEEQRRAKAQARSMRQMKPQEISVDTWLGGYRHLFPDARSETTIADHVRMLRRFRKAHGHERMWEVTAITAQAWTLKHPADVKLLRMAWAKAVVMQIAPFNVWAIVEKPPRTKERVRPPTLEELSGMLSMARGRGMGPRWLEDTDFSDYLLTAAYTGARQGGLLMVRRRDVDLDRGRMVVTEKGDKTRTILLLGPSKAAVARQMRRRPVTGGKSNPRLWPWSREALGRRWVAARGEFPHGSHSLRHFCATWLAEQGVDPLDIAVQLGHTDAAGRPYERLVQRTYSHPDPEIALARIAGIVNQQGGHDAPDAPGS